MESPDFTHLVTILYTSVRQDERQEADARLKKMLLTEEAAHVDSYLKSVGQSEQNCHFVAASPNCVRFLLNSLPAANIYVEVFIASALLLSIDNFWDRLKPEAPAIMQAVLQGVMQSSGSPAYVRRMWLTAYARMEKLSGYQMDDLQTGLKTTVLSHHVQKLLSLEANSTQQELGLELAHIFLEELIRPRNTASAGPLSTSALLEAKQNELQPLFKHVLQVREGEGGGGKLLFSSYFALLSTCHGLITSFVASATPSPPSPPPAAAPLPAGPAARGCGPG